MTGKPVLKLAFSDMWSNFDPQKNFFVELLSGRFQVELTDKPDFLIYSCSAFGRRHLDYDCVRIFYTGENERPDYLSCDFAFTFDFSDDPRHYRLPLYVLYYDLQDLVKPLNTASSLLQSKTRFCNFVYSNPRCIRRNRFFHKLSRYKQVDSGGRYMNNIGGPVKDKLSFLTQYKFTIAFENQSRVGYTTEKIIEPMRAGSAPIYWGNSAVNTEFNPRSFINWHDYGSDEAVIERIIELDRDDKLYLEMAAQPWLHNNAVPTPYTTEKILDRFEEIFSSRIEPVAVRRRELKSYDRARTLLTRVLPWRSRMLAGRAMGKVVELIS